MPTEPMGQVPADETRRVRALRALDLLDSPPEARFDQLVRELAERLGAPIAYLSLVAAERQWIKASVGPMPQEADRAEAFCNQTIHGRESLVVPDATRDPRFAGSALVTGEPFIRFYAGVPITDREGHAVGTVCVAGPQPRELSARELVILHGYADRLAEEVNARQMIFLAYARADEDWAGRFLAQGQALVRRGLVDPWSSERLERWDSGWPLKDALFRARTALLLLSPRFLASRWVRAPGLHLLLKVKETERLKTLPALLESCAWQEVEWLAGRAAWPGDGTPLAELAPAEAERRLAELARRLLPGAEVAATEPEPAAAATPPVAAAAAPAVAVAPAAGRLFLSHAGEDGAAVRALAERLRQAGVDLWLDLDELQPGDNWMESLEEALQESTSFAVYIGRSGVARWINREVRVALDRNTKDPSYRFLPILAPGSDPDALPSFVSQHQWLDLRDGENDPRKLQQLVGAILRRPAEAVPLIPPGEPPFRGLASFDGDHAHLFFGRDRETQALIERLQVAPFLAVVGDSGSGKSSLVRAGLLPALVAGQMLDDGHPVRDWRIATLRPGGRPFRQLRTALLDLEPELDAAARLELRASLGRQLATGTGGLRACVDALAAPGEHTVVVVDQFEEIFTHATDTAERDRFIDVLLAASDRAGERPLYTIVTLRADFYSLCFEHPRLPAAVSANQFAVRAIDREQMPDVIKKPAAMAGLKLEPGLVEAILFDLGDGPGNLPLLQHTLLRLWNRRTGEILTHQSYEALGRVQGALEHHAEEVYGHLAESDREHARKLLLRLVVPGKDGATTRRRVPRAELIPAGAAGADAERVLQILIDRRLLTLQVVRDGDEEEELVEVVHEALLRSWSRLGRWLDRDREFLLWRQRTRVAFEAWEESGRDPGALLRGGPLAEARRWMAEQGDDLSEAGRRFLLESERLATRKRWLRRSVVAMIAALAVVASWQAWEARVESYRARTQALVEQARGRQPSRLDLALLLALEVDRRGAKLEARRLLSEGLESSPGLETILHGHRADVRAVAWSRDGRWLASASGAEPYLLLWDLAAESPDGRPLAGAGGALWSVQWSPVSRLLAAAGESGAILVWDLDAGSGEPRRLSEDGAAAGSIYALRFSPDGRRIAAARSDQTLALWEVGSGRRVGPALAGAEDWLKSIAWSPDGAVVAAAGMDKAVRRWDTATGKLLGPALRGHAEGVMSLDWSPDGRRLASGGLDGTAVIWDPASGERQERLEDSQLGAVASVAWGSDSRHLLIGGTEGRVQIWDVERRRPRAPPAAGQMARLLSAVWSPDGRRLASGNGSTVVLWSADPGPRLGRPIDLGATDLRGLAASPDGRLLAAVGRDPTSQKLGVRVWDRASGRPLRVLEEVTRVPELAWTGDGWLAAASSDRSTKRWDLEGGRLPEERHAGDGARVTTMAWDHAAARLALATRDGAISFWDWAGGEPTVARGGVGDARVTHLAWSPDGAILAAGASDGTLWLWDAATAEPLAEPVPVQGGRLGSLAWSPDGRTLAAGGDEGSVELWSRTGAALGSPLAAHDGRVLNLAWSPDGRTLATAGKEGIFLWDVARRTSWAGPLAGHQAAITALAFGPDGATLTSVDLDGLLRHWDVDLESWRARACRVADRELTAEEWRLYLPDSRRRPACGAYLAPGPRRSG